MKKYSSIEGFILNENLEKDVKIENGQSIHFLPWVKFNKLM